jgi:hypothetical protein
MRYALIAVAIGGALLCLFVAWRLALGEQASIGPQYDDPDYTVVISLVVAAIVLGIAAGGLVARRAEGAYLLGIGAFMLAIPLFGLALLSLAAWDTSQTTAETRQRNDLARLVIWGAVGLDLWVGVQGIRLGRRMSRERLEQTREAN